VAVANFNYCFNEWYSSLLSAVRPYLQNYLTVVPNEARFGKDVSGYHARHKQLTRVLGVLVMTYWRAWDYNTWYAPTVDDCKQDLPLGSFMTDQTITCMLKEMDCIGLDVRPLLQIAGIRPLPDGIGVMVVNGTGDCDSIVFQVNRERRTDIPPTTNINYL
jgi:hypothetical protein